MPFIQISNLTAAPANINPGDQVTIDYDISGDDGAPLQISYTIQPFNNIHFVTGTGPRKVIVEQGNLVTPPMHVTDVFTIDKDAVPPGGDFHNFTITVFVQDTAGLSSDSGLCSIQIS